MIWDQRACKFQYWISKEKYEKLMSIVAFGLLVYQGDGAPLASLFSSQQSQSNWGTDLYKTEYFATLNKGAYCSALLPLLPHSSGCLTERTNMMWARMH